ncbi:uncharacterized protein LOC120408292 isoform X2 [Mauremys reevesii]|uniref:uncharacterized protein LOC120408292 isoform X2 n=1 Tax=Mauremys reevesii TaxID=260615 RepID=UPI00193EDAE6|nr:uncharacterized protein LOC120408292 isoform X2 [Mauremys reevesii]
METRGLGGCSERTRGASCWQWPSHDGDTGQASASGRSAGLGGSGSRAQGISPGLSPRATAKMYQLKIQAELPVQSGSDMRAQELKELLWSGGECNAALIRDGAFRQKKLARQLVEGGACKEQLMAGEQQPQLFQSGFEEKLAFQPEAEGTERRPKRLVRGPREAYRVMDAALQCDLLGLLLLLSLAPDVEEREAGAAVKSSL